MLYCRKKASTPRGQTAQQPRGKSLSRLSRTYPVNHYIQSRHLPGAGHLIFCAAALNLEPKTTSNSINTLHNVRFGHRAYPTTETKSTEKVCPNRGAVFGNHRSYRQRRGICSLSETPKHPRSASVRRNLLRTRTHVCSRAKLNR